MQGVMYQWIDIFIIATYMTAMIGVGSYFTRRQKSASEYLLASREVGWFAIGLSLLGTLNSAIDYVIGPAQIIEFGFMNLVMILPVFISFPFIFKCFLPFYQRLRLYNCYEYLEHRFDVRVRITVTLIFILWRIAWMGTTLYLPAYVLNVVMGWDLFITVAALGLITTAYTTLGGVRGAIWTDVAQAFVMFAGLILATVLVIHQIPGGFSQVWGVSREAGFMYFTAKIPGMADAPGLWSKLSLYFHANLTFWSVIFVGTISKLTSYGADQVMVQRYLTARSLQDSKNGFILNSLAYVIYSLLFILLGMGLFAYFKLNPLPEGTKYEYMFPYFIHCHLPVIMKGLVIAAIYAAAQSSVSSGITATSAAIFSDFYLRLFHGQISADEHVSEQVQRGQVRFSRFCALGLGLCVTLFACLIHYLHANESLFSLFNKMVGSFAGLIIPIFLLGMFSRRVGSLGVCLGAICGFAATYYWAFHTTLGYGWTSCVAFVVIVGVSYAVSVVEPRPSEERLAWRWRSIMERPGDVWE
ncbi:MAG TPA: sodium/solute symporter [Candidatus Hydrogenedentes bacterium]|nr:sodium/solute symporter [Candidatus Hydrogenedentota bacterium]